MLSGLKDQKVYRDGILFRNLRKILEGMKKDFRQQREIGERFLHNFRYANINLLERYNAIIMWDEVDLKILFSFNSHLLTVIVVP